MAGLVILALSYVMSQFYRSFLAVLSPVLTSELAMSPSQISSALGTWFITFALAQFVVGSMLDRFGPRITASLLFGLFAGGGGLVFAFATTGWMITLAMGLIGIGCAPVLMSSIYIFARTYSAARFAILTSWFIAVGSAGNLIGASPLARAADAFGWRPVMLGLAGFTFAIAVVIFVLVRNPDDPHKQDGVAKKGSYLDLLKIRQLWPIIPMMLVAYSLPVGLRGLWSGPFFGQVYGMDTLGIGEVTLWIAIAMVVASLLYGPLDTMFNTRKWVVIGGNLLMVVCITMLAVQPLAGIFATTVLFILVCMLGLSYGIMMAHARAFYPSHLLGRGVTLMNFFSIGGSGMMQMLSGRVYDASIVPGQPAAAFQTLFWFYAVMSTIGVVIYFFTRDAKPKDET
jgi:MFS family permease